MAVEVRAADVAVCLKRRILPGALDAAEIRASIAEQAGCSTETVKRVEDGKFEWLDLDRADRLLVACGAHLHECEVREG